MAVQPQTPFKEYTANGTTTVFPLDFDCENKDHLIVMIDDAETDNSKWSLNNKQVMFNAAPAVGKKITLQRNTPYRRDRNYQAYDNSFRPDPVNKDFDWIWWKLQELGVADMLLKIYVDRLHTEQKDYIDNQDQVIKNIIADLRNYVNQQDSSQKSYFENLISQQGVSLRQLNDYYYHLLQGIANIAVNKGWLASIVVDKSGKSQQEINDLQNGLYAAKGDMSQDIAPIFEALAQALEEGDTLTLHKGHYFWDGTNGTRVIPTNINLDIRGTIHFKPGTQPFLRFNPNASDQVEIPATQSSGLRKYADNLGLTSVAGISMPHRYYAVITSDEVFTGRTGTSLEQSFYTKNYTVDIATSNFRTRDPLFFDWDNLSLAKIRFIKKARPVTVKGLKVVPTAPMTSAVWLDLNRASNITFEDMLLDGDAFPSQGNKVHIHQCYNIKFKNSEAFGAANVDGSYAILNTGSIYIELESFRYSDPNVGVLGYSSRHGYKCFFKNCIMNGIDDHWGGDYYVDGCSLVGSINIAGGNLTVENSTSQQHLIRLRTDTPYADGTLTVRNSRGKWSTIFLSRHTQGGNLTRHKLWDVIDIDVGTYTDEESANGVVYFLEPYENIDENLIYRETVLKIRNATGLIRSGGVQLIKTDKARANNTASATEIDYFAGDQAKKRMFSKIIIDGVDIVDTSVAAAVKTLATFPVCTTLDVRNVDGFNFDVLRAKTLKLNEVKYTGVRSGALSIDVEQVVLKGLEVIDGAGTWFWRKVQYPTPKLRLYNCMFPNKNVLLGATPDMILTAVNTTYTSDANVSGAFTDYRGRNNFQVNQTATYTFLSELVIPANGASSEFSISRTNLAITDIVHPRFALGGDGILIKTYQTENNRIRFRLHNLTAAPITVAEASVINFVIH